jgi:tRNA (Thr-GGU) A37 N-methylase
MIRSILKKRKDAPMQGSEGAPDAWLELAPFAVDGMDGLAAGDDIIVVTWLHEARRDVLKVHPRSDPGRPLAGVFHNPFSGSSQSARTSSCCCTKDREEPTKDWSDRSD